MDRDRVALVLGADLLELRADLAQIQRRAGLRVGGLQRRDDHRRGHVRGDDAADPVGLEDVLSYLRELLGRAREIGRHQIAALEALLDDLVVAHVRRHERGQRAAIDALQVEELLGDAAHDVDDVLAVDVAVAHLDRDQHLVRAAEVRLVVLERLHVLVVRRDHLGEA